MRNTNVRHARAGIPSSHPHELAEILSDLGRNTERLIAWSSSMELRITEVAADLESRIAALSQSGPSARPLREKKAPSEAR
jgi:hypothetical protein